MGKIFVNRKFGGFVWHFIFAGLFIGLSLLILEYVEGTAWFLISTVLRVIFGTLILITSSRLFGRKISDILSPENTRGALIAGSGFLILFLYNVVTVASGYGGLTGFSAALFISKVILQQASTGFYEELNYRFLLLEGIKHTRNTVPVRLAYVLTSSVLFGLLHCIPEWDTYTFIRTAVMGFGFAVIFVKSGNILVPMVLHFLYDIVAKMTGFIEWNHNAFFDGMSSAFEIMLAVMFVISFVILVMNKKDHVER